MLFFLLVNNLIMQNNKIKNQFMKLTYWPVSVPYECSVPSRTYMLKHTHLGDKPLQCIPCWKGKGNLPQWPLVW